MILDLKAVDLERCFIVVYVCKKIVKPCPQALGLAPTQFKDPIIPKGTGAYTKILP